MGSLWTRQRRAPAMSAQRMRSEQIRFSATLIPRRSPKRFERSPSKAWPKRIRRRQIGCRFSCREARRNLPKLSSNGAASSLSSARRCFNRWTANYRCVSRSQPGSSKHTAVALSIAQIYFARGCHCLNRDRYIGKAHRKSFELKAQMNKSRAEDIRILVVDDEPMMSDSLRQHLADEGYTVDTASSGAWAIDLFDGGAHHLVICDLQLPDMRSEE